MNTQHREFDYPVTPITEAEEQGRLAFADEVMAAATADEAETMSALQQMIAKLQALESVTPEIADSSAGTREDVANSGIFEAA